MSRSTVRLADGLNGELAGAVGIIFAARTCLPKITSRDLCP